jgi:NAD(P)-dependent dehydrogenase (short-subunit alcohol dehydrogenase family)
MSLKAQDLFNVEGRTALVTGATSGVGKLIASVLTANGVRTYITGRNAERLGAAHAELSQAGDCVPLQANLSTGEGIDKLVADIEAREDKLDILVNNAGATWAAAIEDYPPAGWDRVFDLNVKAPFFLAQKLIPRLAAAASDEDWSRVVNIGSVSATASDASMPAYIASKAALHQLTKVMAKGFAKHRITANSIAPGWFHSRINAPIQDTAGKAWLAGCPLGRFGGAEDVGGLALFLCSRAGIYVNGQVIACDGGRSA